MEKQKIAIIGMSARFAGAKSVDEFRKMLSEKKIEIDVLSTERRTLMNIDADKELMKCGYLQEVDTFDPDFFGITNREARLMSPEQRLSMELVAETILDAGYSLKGFRGTKCGVFVAGGNSDYNNYVEKQSSTSIIGSEPYMLSGRIGYQFDLQGENITVNSGCSSSMVAINIAREKLMLHQIDAAVVGGVIVYVKPMEKGNNMYDILGIMSDDYTLNPFDEKADGTALGEGGGYVLLKRLQDAKKDGDYIYGVINECVVNGDGGRCESVSMPSMDAQRDVIDNAWKQIDVSKLTEIEAHGIGAAIGDAVESDGIIQAMENHGTVGKNILLSTVKANIGHLVTCSGMSSLIKVLMGYKYKETYPIAGLENVSKLVRANDRGVIFLDHVKKWKDDEKRITGINSFGLSGCNAHMIVENHIEKNRKESTAPKMIKISAKTKVSFDRMKAEVAKYLQQSEWGCLDDLEFTLNTGRDDYLYRGVAFGTSEGSLGKSVEGMIAQNQKTEWKVIFAAKSDEETSLDELSFHNAFPRLRNRQNDYFLASIYEWITEIGIPCHVALMDKLYQAAFSLWSNRITEEEYNNIKETFSYNDETANYYSVIDKKIEDGNPTILIDFTKNHLFEKYGEKDNVTVINITTCEGVQQLIGLWYVSGNSIDWSKIYQGGSRKRIPVPTYFFDRKSFWVDMFKREANCSDKSLASQLLNRMTFKKVFYLNRKKSKKVDLHAFPYSDIRFKSQFKPVTGDISFDYQIAMYRLLEEAGIVPDSILGTESGVLLYKWLRGWCQDDELIDADIEDADMKEKNVHDRVRELAKDELVVLFSLEKEKTLPKLPYNNVIVLDLSKKEDFQTALELAADKKLYDGNTNQDKYENIETKVERNKVKTQEQIELESFIEHVWAESLGLTTEIQHDENFFALGGNSLIMQAMSEKINSYIQREYDIFEIYDYDTIEKLAENILAS